MKKISFLATFAIIVMGISKSAFAFDENNFVPFTSLEEARIHCPNDGALTFTPNNPSIPNSAGTITGKNNFNFANIPTSPALYPKNLWKGIITDAKFRESNGIYGYISDNVITCLYTYQTFINTDFALTIRSK